MHEPRSAVVLNVNDDDTIRYVITRILTRAGFVVEEAARGHDALVRLARGGVDLVVLDVRLPDLDGFEVCRRVRAEHDTRLTPVLLTSATFVTSESRVRGLEGGADGYLTQPFEALELVATVSTLLRARRAEEATLAAAREWEATFDGISDGVCLLDPEGRVRRCNAAFRALVVGSRAIEGRPVAEVLAGADAALPSRIAPVLAGVEGSTEAQLGDRWLLFRADALGGAGRVLVASDISERRRLEDESRARAEALAEVDRRKDEFLAMLAHELRNPLNAIGMAIHLQDLVGPADEQSQRLRSAMRRQTQHLARLVDDLLDVARVTRGKILLQKELYDLRSTVQRAVDTCRVLADARRHTLTLSLPDAPVIVDADAMRLEQVVVILLNNAAKYSDPGGHVRVTLAVERGAGEVGEAVLRVRDTGIGIRADMLEAIFDLFTQEDQSLARSMGGLGIGLTMARKLVAMHGGSVKAASEGRGAGAEFTVRLPLHARVEAAAPADGAGTGAGAEAPAKRVLVVEDNADAAEMLRHFLSTEGHHVEVANDGVEGLEIALTMRPDVAVLDIGLPGLDGYQIAERIRAEPACDGMVLVAVTGYGRDEDRARSLSAGFDAHIVKPADPLELARVIDGARPPGRGARFDARLSELPKPPRASVSEPTPS